MLIHDTGNEPGADLSILLEKRRGVEVHIQGRFKNAVKRHDETTSGLWFGGVLPEPLKLGWAMYGALQIIVNFLSLLTRGKLYCDLGTKNEQPHLSFPSGYFFSWVATPPGSRPPLLGSEEAQGLDWNS